MITSPAAVHPVRAGHTGTDSLIQLAAVARPSCTGLWRRHRLRPGENHLCQQNHRAGDVRIIVTVLNATSVDFTSQLPLSATDGVVTFQLLREVN